MTDSHAPDTDDATVPPEAGARGCGIGFSLDWGSSPVAITLAVELPFWLLVPSDTFNVRSDGATVTVSVENDGVELQHGRQFSITHFNTAFIGRTPDLQNATVPIAALPEGGLFRRTRTLLYIDAHAHADAVNAFIGPDGPRFQDGSRYMASLAVAHLPVVNAIINSYRRASIDPFANEVTAWDLPVWFLITSTGLRAIHCQAHLAVDNFPTFSSASELDKPSPLFATSVTSVTEKLTTSEIPGEVELLDGWSLFHRGRFADSVRSFVTAVEVLLESQVTRLLATKGLSPSEIEDRLAATRTNFTKRMREYCALSLRRVPGPLLHPAPEVNGIRLLEEMKHIRRLRHDIVHRGHRLNHAYEKLTLRTAESTSYLFDWLSDGGDFEARRRKNSTLFFALRTTQMLFPSSTVDGRIVICPPGYITSLPPTDADGLLLGRVIYSEKQYFRTISNDHSKGKDLESFVQMSLFELGLGVIEDSVFVEKDGPTIERFFLEHEGRRIGVYLLDVSEPLCDDHILQVASALDRSGATASGTRAILVANTDAGSDWTNRASLSSGHEGLAKSRGISLVSPKELARVVSSAVRLNWSREVIAREIIECGPSKMQPPGSTPVGSAYKYWPAVGVLGMHAAGGTSVEPGDVIAVALKDRFVEATVSEVKIDGAGQHTLRIGEHKLPPLSNERVFLLDKMRTYQPAQASQDDAELEPGAAVAVGFTHPFRAE